MNAQVDIAVLDATAAAAAIDKLADVLADCVAGGASVSFMAPLTVADAARYFARVADEVAAGETVLIAARVSDRIAGTVQLGLALPPNQPHRADVKKLLVHRAARQHGLGAALMRAVEAEARRNGRTLLVLDTANGAAERLYEREGWTRAGTIPGYALWPEGGECDTTIFWKRVG